jgi:DNA-binding helix-hairpin-helix protein with protein kinase domain
MAHYYDAHGRLIALGKELGSGGEGAVFEVGDDPRLAAKIYHRPLDAAKADKLRAMAALASPELTAFASWPLAVLHNGQPNLVSGIVLPRVKDHDEIHKLYSPAQRKFEYPDKDWAFLVHAAMNCAAAFDAIHGQSHVIGDVNQGNVLVSPRGTVFLIDCDSFQVHADGRLFLCDVGVPQYTPPELQGQGFRGLARTVNHDRFGLAVLIFHLLFMGRHPFAGRFAGPGDMPIEQAIAEYRYAFSGDAAALYMAPPPQTLPIDQIAPQVAPLFERAFDRGSEHPDARPTAEEWHNVLAGMLKQLQACQVDRGHKFAAGLTACPWCRLMTDGAPNFFLSVTFRATTPEVLNVTSTIATLWTAIERVPAPRDRALPPAPQAALHIVATPPPPAVESAQALSTMVRYVALAGLLSMPLMFFVPESGYLSVPIFGVFAVWWLGLFLTSGHRPERNRRRRVLRSRRAQLKQLQLGWHNAASLAYTEFKLARKDLATAREQIGHLKGLYETELRRLSRDVAQRQQKAFLQSKFICNYKIDGIGAGRQATLASYGIETAYDVEYNRVLSIPGMGPAMTNTLCAWRSQIERQFTLNAAQGIPSAERQALLFQYAQLRQQLEFKLRHGPDRLREIDSRLEQTLAQMSPQIGTAHIATAQAFADLSIMGTIKHLDTK